MNSEVLTVLSINIIVGWDVTPYILMYDEFRSYDSTSLNFRFQIICDKNRGSLC